MNNEKVQKLLKNIRYASISTVSPEGAPFSAPVWYVVSKSIIYYWSSKNSQHQLNIDHNSHAYITIFDSTAEEGEGFGLYLEALVSEVSNRDLDLVIDLYNASTKVFKLDRNNTTGIAPTRLYSAKIVNAWVNDGSDDSGFWEDTRRFLSS